MANEFVVDFNPLMTQTMTEADLQKLLLSVPRPAFWNGRTYTIKSEHIGAGVYEVTGDFR
jgi:hypothetical protein